MTRNEEYARHLSNAAMYRRDAERMLDMRYEAGCATGSLNYARIHERQAAEILASMTSAEHAAVPPAAIPSAWLVY